MNRQIYQRLKQALSLNLRRQVFIAVCDDLLLRDYLSQNLQTDLTDLSHSTYQQQNNHNPVLFVTLQLNLSYPNPVAQISQWLAQNPTYNKPQKYQILGFQILGVEHLTRQPPTVQWSFISNLKKIETSLSSLESSILIWIPRPWLDTIKQSAPEFWRWHTGVFEFEGDPTPIYSRQKRQNKNSKYLSAPSLLATTTQPSTITVRPLMASEQKSDTVKNYPNNYLLPPAPEKLPELPTNVNQNQLQENIQTPAELVELANLVWAAISQKSSEDKTSGENLQQLKILQDIQDLNKSKYPSQKLAIAYQKLGDFHRGHILNGKISEQSLIIAIRAYEMVIEWTFNESQQEQSTPQTGTITKISPSQIPVLDILNDLGTLYWMLFRHVKSSNIAYSDALVYLERSIILYQMALSNITPYQKHTYARLQKNLGLSYGDLAAYREPEQNWQQSVMAYQEAILYLDGQNDTQDYASTLNNLGAGYWNLAQYTETVTNLQGSISAYAEAVSYFEPETEPLNYAMVQNNLGTAYWNLAQFEKSKTLILKAVEAYQEALKYRTPQNAPSAFAATQNNLGTAYWHLAHQFQEHQIRSQLLQEAIAAYTQALNIVQNLSPGQLTFDLLATHNNLALAHYLLATGVDFKLDKKIQMRNLEAALEHHLQAYLGRQQNISDSEETEAAKVALNYIVRTIRTFYSKYGLEGQNLAFSKIPSHLLGKILKIV
ncbi:MAG: tetratricopeptide repeat protein [Microcoleaceae cyanobacterium MO_207.B10]|nr:tetratricopeptide repeat protein [Microcoleaceae cyanobacterium MO_207.B10]